MMKEVFARLMYAEIQTPSGTLKFKADNDLERYRAETLLTKEPETIAWIDTFSDRDVFYDIGANIGVFSMYARLRFPGIRVVSIEPFHRNYAHLVENIVVNSLSTVTPICVALSDETTQTTFHVPDSRYGASGGQVSAPINERGERFAPVVTVPVLCFRLDDLVETAGLPAPNHIKIDVDGTEDRVIGGMERILENPALRSLLVEVNSSQQRDLVESIMRRQGFGRDEEIDRTAGHSRGRRRSDPRNSAENIVFYR